MQPIVAGRYALAVTGLYGLMKRREAITRQDVATLSQIGNAEACSETGDAAASMPRQGRDDPNSGLGWTANASARMAGAPPSGLVRSSYLTFASWLFARWPAHQASIASVMAASSWSTLRRPCRASLTRAISRGDKLTRVLRLKIQIQLRESSTTCSPK